MRKYVLREYCDKAEAGNERVFDEKKDAVECAFNELRKPSDSDKKVAVYEIKITPEQLEGYNDGNLDVTLSGFATAEDDNNLILCNTKIGNEKLC